MCFSYQVYYSLLVLFFTEVFLRVPGFVTHGPWGLLIYTWYALFYVSARICLRPQCARGGGG